MTQELSENIDFEKMVLIYGQKMTYQEALIKTVQIKQNSSKKINEIMKNKFSQTGITPESERKEISNAFFEANLVSFYLDELVFKIDALHAYEQSKDESFLALKKYLSQNVEKWFNSEIEKKAKKETHEQPDFIRPLFTHKKFKNYFQHFTFNVNSGHNHDLYSVDKNVKIDFNLNGFAFRYFDYVSTIIEQEIKLFKKHNVVDLERIIKAILIPTVDHGCFVCNKVEKLTFNHKNKEVISFYPQMKCLNIKDILSCEIATNSGKVVIINDVREVLTKEKQESLEEYKYNISRKFNIDSSVNCLAGQLADMNIKADLFNISYTSAGNFGCYAYLSENGLVFSNRNDENSEGGFSMNLWGFSILDSDLFYQLAKENKVNTSKLKFIEIEMKPGLYSVNTHLNFFEEDRANDFQSSIFSSMVFKSDNKTKQKMTEEEWTEKLGII